MLQMDPRGFYGGSIYPGVAGWPKITAKLPFCQRLKLLLITA
jgi:hypothetical protein